MIKHRSFSSISFFRISYKIIWLKTWSWYKNPLKNESWKGLNWYFSKDAHQESEGGSVRFKKKLDSFTLETSKNRLIRNFFRTGCFRVKLWKKPNFFVPFSSNTLYFKMKVQTMIFLQEHFNFVCFIWTNRAYSLISYLIYWKIEFTKNTYCKFYFSEVKITDENFCLYWLSNGYLDCNYKENLKIISQITVKIWTLWFKALFLI